MKLTDKDQQIIKYEKRTGFVFSGITLSFGGIYNLSFLLTGDDKNYLILIFVDLFIVVLCIFIIYLMNRKLSKDLLSGVKIVKLEKVQKKECEISYEAGSGGLSIPILGNLFPKLFSKEM